MRQRSLGHHVGAKIRQKRAWILPGTLWCGRGSTAGDYEQLGMFERVDRCCREHDHCSYIIRPFTVNFGVLNPSLFTISHCDCDNRFKQCLLNVNDTVSNMVGYTFFNILKLRCFNLIQKSHCTQLNWFGMCTSVQVAPFAILKNPTPYNLTNANPGTSGISDSPREYQVHTSAKGKEKNMKPKRRKQSNMKRRIHPVVLAKGDTLLLSEKMQQRYAKTKKLSPRTTILPLVWKSATPPSSITIKNSFFHSKNQTINKLRTLSVHKSELMQITPSPGPTRIIHTHTTLSQAKGFSAEILMITSLTKSSTNRRKATTSQNATIQIKLVQTSRKPPKSKHNCDYMKPPRDFNFQSPQEKGKEYKVDIFPRTGRLFVNKTQPRKKAIFSNRTSAPQKNTVSTKFQSQTNSGPTSTMTTTHPKHKIKGSHLENKSANITKRPKIRNPTPAKYMPTTKPRSILWKDIISSRKTTLFVGVPLLKSWKSASSTNQETISSAMKNIYVTKKCKSPKNSSIVNNASKGTMTTTPRRTPKQKSTSIPLKKTVSSTETTETLSYSWKETNSTSKEPTGSPLICDAFRYLDDCKYKIGPMENIYGHHNMESTTVYHCDCIYRFTNNLKQLKKSSILQFLLGKFVSFSCIEISNIKECNKTTGCFAILSKTTELDSSLKKMEEDQGLTTI
ncbi:uncharacterized protein LOC118827048 [Colossoma macropomum]|uniref:uncharacterized protein LOC118827048 n=1 Tax=Colossoma macropomum TaxID=42526 RepID=UPI001864335C|nr:uncharacterized protein LOC118827048 [Colossoma macropomum]